jgi:chromate transport protein ChrA
VDLFLAICTGLGLAIAAGMLAGSLAYEGPNRRWLLALAGAAGAALFAASLTSETDAAWVGIAFGGPLGVVSMGLTGSVVSGARQRAEADPTSVSLMVAGAALVLGLIAYFLSPLALVVGGGLLWLGLARRRRESRKHEGLRVLR